MVVEGSVGSDLLGGSSQDVTDTWLITMDFSFSSPKDRVVYNPFQMFFLWLIHGGDPNHLRYLG